MFGLTVNEIKSIAKATGLEQDEFIETDQAGPELIASAEELHPALARTMNNGRRLRLRVDAKGTCCFLSPKGCSLPRRARPIFCRMFPVFVEPQGELVLMLKEGCLAQEGAACPEEVLKRLGQTEKGLRNMHARLLRLSAAHKA